MTTYTIFHPDLHIGNIFVDDNFNITCLIDWVSTSTGPIAELMAAPSLTNKPLKHLIDAIRQGFNPQNSITPESWRRSDMIWHFERLLRLLSTQDYTLFKELYKIVYNPAADDQDVTLHFRSPATHESNKELLANLQADDATSEELKQEELATFGTLPDQRDSRAVARKLTVMAEINKDCLTDSKLRKWIEDVLKWLDRVPCRDFTIVNTGTT